MRINWLYTALFQLLLIFTGCFNSYGQALTDDPAIINDHMFPGTAAAKPFSDFDAKGFIINGKRTFLVSAGIEYARVPHELWWDRLLRLKRGGFNCVEVYTIWNFHEPEDGVFKFSGDQDLNLFLDLVKEMGMYSIVRVGPYYCAEWNQGGYPLWLRFKEGVRVREDNAAFKKYVDRFFDHLYPIVFKHQINKGGSVIMVQLENEHPKGWGTIMPDGYFRHLRDKALRMGMAVPYFFSGLHHDTDPAKELPSLDDPKRPNPWFSTEFWSMWYNQSGAKPKDAELYNRRTWKVIAHGGQGYNFYMAHGGSNFGYDNNDEDAASYDYGAAVGQAGDLRPIYYTFKRAAFFARSFQETLESSTDATGLYRQKAVVSGQVPADTAIRITARGSKAGDLIFIDNPASVPVSAKIWLENGLPEISYRLSPGELLPLVHGFGLTKDLKLNWALSRIYGIAHQGQTTTIMVEANAGDQVYLDFVANKNLKITPVGQGLKITGSHVVLNAQGHLSGKPSVYAFKAGGKTIRILVMDRQASDYTWLTDKPGLNAIVMGVPYLGAATFKNNKLQLETEAPLAAAPAKEVTVYFENGTKRLQLKDQQANIWNDKDTLLMLSGWQKKQAILAAKPDFNDQQWLSSANPLQMGADGDLTANAWYRTKLNIPVGGKYTLQVEGGDRGRAFVDGLPIANWNIREGEVVLDMGKGPHSLAIFTAHDGRDKMAAYLGPIDQIDQKGLSGKPVLKLGGPFIKTLENWYFKKMENLAALRAGPPVLDTLTWAKYKIGDDAFQQKEGYGWFVTTIPAMKNLSQLVVNFKSVDENATVFVNGVQVAQHEGWNIPFKFAITDPQVLSKPMVMAIFIENHSKEGGIDQPVKLNTIGDGIAITGWRMKGGPDTGTAAQEWVTMTADTNGIAAPAFFRTSFTLPALQNRQLIWRVNPTQLGHGSIWVNGHNLGRYPEKNGPIGLYIPEVWLNKGKNELVIFDEEGKSPAKAGLSAEVAASRNIHIYNE